MATARSSTKQRVWDPWQVLGIHNTGCVAAVASHEHRQCGRNVSSHMRQHANKILDQVSAKRPTYPLTAAIIATLQEVAGLLCCSQYHQGDQPKSEVLRTWRQRLHLYVTLTTQHELMNDKLLLETACLRKQLRLTKLNAEHGRSVAEGELLRSTRKIEALGLERADGICQRKQLSLEKNLLSSKLSDLRDILNHRIEQFTLDHIDFKSQVAAARAREQVARHDLLGTQRQLAEKTTTFEQQEIRISARNVRLEAELQQVETDLRKCRLYKVYQEVVMFVTRKKLEKLGSEQVALQGKADCLSVWRNEAIMEVVAHAVGVCSSVKRQVLAVAAFVVLDVVLRIVGSVSRF